MTTALDVITDSLQKLGVYAPGDTITDADAQRALIALNDMVDGWSNESLMCFEQTEMSFPIAVGQTQYTVGSGGNVNVVRPLRVAMGPGSAYSVDTMGNKYYCEMVPRSKWNLIGSSGSSVTSNIPTISFYDPTYPLATMNVFPTPNSGGYTFYFDSDLQLVSGFVLSTAISLPPGYKKALQDNLALELVPYFQDQPAKPELVMAARKSKANIKRTNTRTAESVYDAELYQSAQQTYNVYTDS